MNNQIIVNFQSLYDYENGINKHIYMKDPDEDIKKQRYPDEIVIPIKKIRIKYEHPIMRFPKIFTYETKNEIGFTMTELAKTLCDEYKKFCAHEKGMINDPAIDIDVRSLLDLPYGIWDYENLFLYEVRQKEGNLFLLGVDSIF